MRISFGSSMLPSSYIVAIADLSLIASLALLPASVSTNKVVCNAADYCPNGWSVHRKASYDATTCDPMIGIKCDKPYQCVHSQCGMSFCCVNTKHLKQWMEQKEAEADMHDDSQEEL
ncbi:hypothetical protein V3C99_014998 [Haemonchus contortus]